MTSAGVQVANRVCELQQLALQTVLEAEPANAKVASFSASDVDMPNPICGVTVDGVVVFSIETRLELDETPPRATITPQWHGRYRRGA